MTLQSQTLFNLVQKLPWAVRFGAIHLWAGMEHQFWMGYGWGGKRKTKKRKEKEKATEKEKENK